MAPAPDEAPPDHACDGHHPGTMAPHAARLNGIAALHGLAFLLQGLLLAHLLHLHGNDMLLLLAGFTAAGLLLAVWWRFWPTMPHWLDMSLGMAGVGSLGMYFGMWSDHDFGDISDLEIKFWSYGCMLLACNLAMFTLTHHAHHHRSRAGFLSMIVGGNIGMVVGMPLGKLAVALLPALPMPFEMLCRLLGMSLGMIVGMLVGSAALRSLLQGSKSQQHGSHG
jgi:hypothetical protein